MRWQAFEITDDQATIGGKNCRGLYPPKVLSQPLLDGLGPPPRWKIGDPFKLRSDHPVRSCCQIVADTPIDESEKPGDENRKHPSHHQGPIEGVGAQELWLAHRISLAECLLDVGSEVSLPVQAL